MSDFTVQRMSFPVTTGRVQPTDNVPQVQSTTEIQGPSFAEILSRRLEGEKALSFSKHAVNRVEERGIELSDGHLERLSEGMRLAESKGLGDTLILVDSTAFIVNAKNRTVITTVDSNSLAGNVFTNIDGTVVI